jgi:hypothetical protein
MIRVFYKIFAFLLVASFFQNQVKAQFLSDSAKVYLLTASPGEETYAAFGHSAIRVADPARGMDFVFNYGTFDFSTPHFYWKFSTGRLLYSLSVQEYQHFLMSYQSWGQAIYQQKILLTNKEKWQLINNLETNYQPENRYYRYDFFKDNCATRIRDIIEKSVDGKIVYDSSYITKNQSFRQLIAYYLDRQPWAFFGINILLGKGTDSLATLRDYMFLPEHMRDLYTRTKILRGDSLSPIMEAPVELFPTTLNFQKPSPLTLPVTVFWYIFIIIAIVSYCELKNGKRLRALDFSLFLIIGLLGALILFLMIFSLHKVLEYNYNIVWANPAGLFIAAGVLLKTKPLWYQYLLMAFLGLLIMFIPVSFVIGQDIPSAAYPIICILILRILLISNVIKRALVREN